MMASRPEPHSLAGAYALDALTGADRDRFERHMARCEQCAWEVRGLREATARLAAAAAAEPPDGLIGRVLAAAARTRQLPPSPRRHAPKRPARRPAWAQALVLAVTMAALALAGIAGLASRAAQHQLQQDGLRSHAIAAVLTARDATVIRCRVATGGRATVVMSRRQRALVFAAAGLRPLPSSKRYELWLMGSDGDTPAGMLPVPGRGMTGPVLASDLNAGDRLGLSVEPAAGSPRPTSALLMLLPL